MNLLGQISSLVSDFELTPSERKDHDMAHFLSCTHRALTLLLPQASTHYYTAVLLQTYIMLATGLCCWARGPTHPRFRAAQGQRAGTQAPLLTPI